MSKPSRWLLIIRLKIYRTKNSAHRKYAHAAMILKVVM